MGAFLDGQRRRLGTSTALALILVLALAGSTSAGVPVGRGRRDGCGARSAGVTAAPMDQEAASVTVPGERRYPEPAATQAGPPRPCASPTTGSPVGKAIHADIAGVLLKAYRSAVAGSPPGCHLPVSLLAAIGQVESGSLVGRPIDAEHRTSVVGPVLDGRRHAAIPDTDGGRLDGDTTWDRAVGPMQFLPSTWRTFGVDGDGNGVADPQDVEDAAASTAAYLCYGGRDLTQQAGLRTAILSYNHSVAYLRLVLTYQQRFAPLDSAAVDLPTVLALTATPVAAPSVAAGHGAHATPGRSGTPTARTPPGRRRRHPTRATEQAPDPRGVHRPGPHARDDHRRGPAPDGPPPPRRRHPRRHRPPRPCGRRSARCCRAAASGTRPSTPATRPSSSRSRA